LTVGERMRRARSTVLALVTALTACSSSGDDEGNEFSPAELDIISTLSPMPPLPANPTNRYADNLDAARFGRTIFNETRYSGAITVDASESDGALGALGETGKVGCASCHNPDAWYMDARSQPGNVSLGVGYTLRNAPSLVNVAYYRFFGWAEKQDNLWTQASGSPESKDNTAGNRLSFVHMLYDHFKDEYEAVFPDLDPALDASAPDADRFPASGKPKANADDPDGAWENMTAEDRTYVMRVMSNVGKAIEAFERHLVSHDAPFDRFVAGDTSAMSASARRGLKLFIGKAACVACHADATFTDNLPHNTGVAQEGPNLPETDEGHFTDATLMLNNRYNGASEFSDDPEAGAAKLAEISAEESERGAFRTKSLRQIAETGPYMHTGSLQTLEEVVDFYDRGGDESGFSGTKDALMRPLNLSSAERADLVEFLRSLTGAYPDLSVLDL
jgi:cytochrome c peroxidase